MKKRLLAILLTVVLLLTIVPTAVLADNQESTESTSYGVCDSADSADSAISGSGYLENPLYAYHADFSAELLEESSSDVKESGICYLNVDNATRCLRDSMEARQTDFTLYISADRVDMNSILRNAYSEEYADSPTTGDYLRWSWSMMYWEYSMVADGRWKYTVHCAYYDTAEQEAAFREKLDATLNDLLDEDESCYSKVSKIQEYIITHVTYDYDGLATHDDDYLGYDENYNVTTYIDQLGNNDNLIYTAYDALCNGKSVDQGYATLFYAMCKACGVNVRIQDGNNHYWNIVELHDLWYYVDTAWDTESGTSQYFLNGTDSFTGHSPKASYSTEAYIAEHPLSATDYEKQPADDIVCTESTHVYGETTVTLPANCMYTGVSVQICENCGLHMYTLSKTSHTYSATVTAPECSTQGYTTYTCEICGDSYQSYYLDATGHTWDAGEITTPATATTDGVRTYTCSVCGETKTETIPATGSPFEDVQNSKDYFYTPVLWAVSNGVTDGTSPTTFSPNATCTRGQVVTFLWRAAGKPEAIGTNPFIDVKESDYFYDAVLWAVSKGITNGTSPTTFSPNAKCTRGQVVTFLWRAEGNSAVGSVGNPFADVKASDYYYNPVLWAVDQGITNGTSPTTFSPNTSCTRGQVVTFLYRYLDQ